MSNRIVLKVQRLNGRFVVDIPPDVATAERLEDGQLVSVKILRTSEDIALAKTSGPTLEEMLESYDSDIFEGEMMDYPPAGREIIK